MNGLIDPATEMLIAQVAGNPRALLNLARTLLLPKGHAVRAAQLCEQAVAAAPDDAEVAAMAHAVRSQGVGSWYFTMVQDSARHDLYARAFRQVLKPGCTVLDIGAGTGLFAMLAARMGAGKVIACERDAAVASAAQDVIALNGYADRVTLLAKDSRALEIGVDMAERADVLLWDNLANNLLGASGADTVADAKRRLLKPGAPIIPCRAELWVALLHDRTPLHRAMGIADGFDMTPFNRLRPTNFTIDGAQFVRASGAAKIFDIDFATDAPLKPDTRRVELNASAAATVTGIAQWLRFHIAQDIVYDTGDVDNVMAFGTQCHAVEPFAVQPGQKVMIGGTHDRERTWFWTERV